MLRLDNGESGELIQALTSQTLTYIGSASAATSSPVYSSHNIVSDGDSLTTAIGKIDADATFRSADETITGHWTFSVTSASNSPDFIVTDALNTSVSRVGEFTHLTSGTAGAGIGTELALLAENAAGSSVLTASLQGVFSTVTAGSETSYADLYITSSGSSINTLRSTSSYTRIGQTGGGYELLIGKTPSTNGTGRLYFLNSNTQKNWKISHNDAVAGGFEIAQEVSAGSETWSNPFFTIASNGNVGVNALSPDVKFEIIEAATQLRLTYTDGAVYANQLVNSSGYWSIISTGGKYGFGTSSPVEELELVTNQDSPTTFIIRNHNNSAGSVSRMDLEDTLSTSALTSVSFSQSYTGTFSSTSINNAKLKAIYDNSLLANTNGLLIGTVAAVPLYLITSGNERMRIDSSGNVGIGTTGPDAKLDVLSTTEQIRQTYTDGSVYTSLLTNSSGYWSAISTGKKYGFGIASPVVNMHLDNTGDAAVNLFRITGDIGSSIGIQVGSTSDAFFMGHSSTANLFTINHDSPMGTLDFRGFCFNSSQEAGIFSSPVSGIKLQIGSIFSLNSSGELLLPAITSTTTAKYGSQGGFARAWGYFKRVATGPPAITASSDFGCSISSAGAGVYDITFDNPLEAISGTIPKGSVQISGTATLNTFTTTGFQIVGGPTVTGEFFSFTVHGFDA